MKVLHITSSSASGGGPEHLRLLLARLGGLGVASLVAAPPNGPYWPRFLELAGPGNMLALPERRFRLPALARLVVFARSRRPDILHSHGKGAGLYARLAGLATGIPCVHTFHGLHLQYRPLLRQTYILLERLLGRTTAAAVAVSLGEAEQACSLGFCPASRLTVVPNGVVVADTPDPFDAAGPFRVVHISRFDLFQKNSEALTDVAQALSVLGLLSRVEFVLLGDGPALPPLRASLEAAGFAASFRFEGVTSDVRPYLRGAGCVLSTSRWEGLPLALLEAQSEGVPVVVSDVVGNREALQPGVTGFLFPLARPDEAARHIAALVTTPGLRQKMGHAAHALALERWNADRMAEQTAAIYRRVVRKEKERCCWRA